MKYGDFLDECGEQGSQAGLLGIVLAILSMVNLRARNL